MLAPLTSKQKEILDFINIYQQANSIAPSLQEIKDHFNLRAISTVHEHVEKLKAKGYLRKEMNQARGIRTIPQTETSADMVEVQILGNIAAGEPIEAVEVPQPYMLNTSLLPGPGNYFLLRVKGTSMIEDGILSDDLVVIKSQNQAQNGDTVVAVVGDNTATLKRFYLEEGRVCLKPANAALKPMYYRNVEIRGKVVALIRNY